MEKLTEKSCIEFVELLAAAAPVPGGGGAAALIGALGTALCSMTGNFTVGKKKYTAVENDIKMMIKRCEELYKRELTLVEEDAAAFEPLSKAYAVPKDDPHRENILEEASLRACSTPLEIMHCCCKAIEILEEMLIKGSRMLISDVGCGAILCKAALESAALNVFINTKNLKDNKQAEIVEKEADSMLEVYCFRALCIAEKVMKNVRN